MKGLSLRHRRNYDFDREQSPVRAAAFLGRRDRQQHKSWHWTASRPGRGTFPNCRCGGTRQTLGCRRRKRLCRVNRGHVCRIDALSCVAARAKQKGLSRSGALCDLCADRRHVHPNHANRDPRRMGLDSVCPCVVAGRSRHFAQDLDHHKASLVTRRPVLGSGLVDRRRDWATFAQRAVFRTDVVAGRRHRVHGRHGIFCRPTCAVLPFCLALVRHDGNDMPLRCRVVLRRLVLCQHDHQKMFVAGVAQCGDALGSPTRA